MKHKWIYLGVVLLPIVGQAGGLRQESYSPDKVVNIRAKPGIATQVLLDPRDAIVGSAGGDNEGWLIQANQGDSSMFIKPTSRAHETNLIVVSKRHNYVFALKLVKEDADWQVRLTFDEGPEAAMVAAEIERRERIQQAMAVKPIVVNENYSMQGGKGSDALQPVKAWDDGRFTYLKIPNNREMPAVYRIAPDGEESIVDRHVEDRDTLAIHEIAQRFVLRLGKQVVGIWNDSFDVDGKSAASGVTRDGVERVVKGGGQ